MKHFQTGFGSDYGRIRGWWSNTQRVISLKAQVKYSTHMIFITPQIM